MVRPRALQLPTLCAPLSQPVLFPLLKCFPLLLQRSFEPLCQGPALSPSRDMHASLRAFISGLIMSASLHTACTTEAGAEDEWMVGGRQREGLRSGSCPGSELLRRPKL